MFPISQIVKPVALYLRLISGRGMVMSKRFGGGWGRSALGARRGCRGGSDVTQVLVPGTLGYA